VSLRSVEPWSDTPAKTTWNSQAAAAGKVGGFVAEGTALPMLQAGTVLSIAVYMLAIEPLVGIYTDEPASEYYVRRLDEASASGLKQILRSPAHYRHWCMNPEDDKESPALSFGRALHCAVAEATGERSKAGSGATTARRAHAGLKEGGEAG